MSLGWRVAARTACIAIALALGWLGYMVGVLLTMYDGIPVLFVQALTAVLFSGVSVALALAAGLVLRVPALWHFWNSSRAWAISILAASVGLLTLGYPLGLRFTATNPDTGSELVMLHPAAAVCGYFGLLFAVANFPVLRVSDEPAA